MIVIGLTGSIGMGKTTTAAMLKRMDVPVFEADRAVHRLLSPSGQAYSTVASRFSEAVRDGKIDRKAMGDIVFNDSASLAWLESVLHPLVARERAQFLKRHRRSPVIVLDIPLLFECGLDRTVDRVMTVSAPRFLQSQRVMARPGMTQEKFRQILARQVPDAEKRRRSDFVIRTGGSRAATLKQLQAVLKQIDSCSHARNRSRHRGYRLRSQPRPPAG